MRETGALCFAREQSRAFWRRWMACRERRNLMIHEGVALFGGAATVPELRRRGLQAALLDERMRYAFEQGCDLAMMWPKRAATRSAMQSGRDSASPTRG